MSRKRILPGLVRLGKRVQARIFGTPVPEEVEEEFGFHVEMRVREYLAEGMTIEEARVEAVRRFGDIDEVKAICRRLGEQRERKTMWKTWLAELMQDLYFGVRQLRRSPGLAATAVLTLALGIGANTAVFSVVNGVVLAPLPYPDADRLVEVRTRYLPPSGFDIPRFPISVPEFLDYREASTSYERLGIYRTGQHTLTGGDADPVRAGVVFLDRAALEALGVRPEIGRWFTTEEDVPGVATGLLDWDLWQTRYGADPGVVGSTIETSGGSFLVTGVMPEGFAFPSNDVQLYENIGIDPADPGNRAGHGSVGIGRLRDGVTPEQLRAEANAIHAGWEEEFPHNVAHFPIVESLPENIVGADVRRSLFLLMAAVAVVLLIAVANVANLLLARGDRRRREMAVRSSLGAGRGRIVRQLLTESLVLASTGALLGLLLGHLGVRALLRIDPGALPRSELIGLDPGVLLFTAAVTVGTALLFGIAPALGAGDSSAGALGSEGRTTSTVTQRRLRRWLVTGEVALSVVVLVAAGLIGRSFRTLLAVDPGVSVENVLTFSVVPSGEAYAESERVVDFHRTLRERLAALPGVTDAAAVTHLPLTGQWGRNDFLIEGRTPAPGEPTLSAQWTAVLPGYFRTMGVPVEAGRALQESDRPGTENVVVVSEDVVDRYFGGESPIGARIAVARDSAIWARVVGVVPRTQADALDAEQVPQIYFTHAQAPEFVWPMRGLSYTLRTGVPPGSLTGAVRRTVAELDPTIPVERLRTMESVLGRSVAQPRLVTTLFGGFATIALILAAVGIYGVVSYSVSRRTREIGIRMALGAHRGRIARLVVREGAWPALVGVAIGVGGALLATGMLGELLFRTSPRDPAVFLALPLGLVAVAVFSSWLPARRATRLAPTEALREE